MSAIDYNEKIPNNVNLAEDRRLQRALENWQPRFNDWWNEMGPDGFTDNEVYLRTAIDVGDPVWVISHPASTFYYLSHGIVGRRFVQSRRGREIELLDITADYARGSSGAPVLDATGAVVGVVRSTRSIYYEEDDGQQKNLQMVFKHCVPARAVKELAAGE